MQKKQNSIVLWRIIFTYVVAIYHFDVAYAISNQLGIRSAWYIAVEFFFIVSGYLLYSNLDKLSKTCDSGLAYLRVRFCKLYPYYLGSFILCLLLYAYLTGERVIDLLVTHVFEAFAMQGIGLNVGWVYVNDTAWYISVVLIAGFLIYHCLVKWKDTFVKFVAPIIVMAAFSYFFRFRGNINAVLEAEGLFLSHGLLRGLSGMCLGIFAAEGNAWLQREKRDGWWMRLLGVMGFLFVIVGSVKYGISEMDFLFAVVLAVAVAIGFLPSEAKIFRMRWIQKWSDLTLSIYLVHYAFSEYVFAGMLGVPDELSEKLLYVGIYLVTITIAAMIFNFVIRKIKVLFGFIINHNRGNK